MYDSSWKTFFVMKCSNCGKQVPDVVYYCMYCGNSMQNSEEVSHSNATTNPVVPTISNEGACSYKITQILSYVPGFALHRFYTGRVGSGVVQFLLWGVFVGAIWQFVDIILILTNTYTDGKGKKLAGYSAGFACSSLLVCLLAFFFVFVPAINQEKTDNSLSPASVARTGTLEDNINSSPVPVDLSNNTSSNAEDEAREDKQESDDKKSEQSALKSSFTKVATDTRETPELKPAPIAGGAIYKYPETAQGLKKAGFPKMLKKYGVKKIKEINRLLPIAAEKASYNPTMDEIVHVDISENRSTKNHFVFYVDAKNCNRIYLTEEELKSNKPVYSNQEKLKALLNQHELMCENIIKSQLTHPSTYSKSIMDSVSETQEYTNVIRIAFSAKNSFNLEIKYVAVFRVNANSEITYQDVQEKQ